MALLLRAAVAGVQAQPLGQVVDREWSRARLGAALGVVGHPQMVLRVGYAKPGRNHRADRWTRSSTAELGPSAGCRPSPVPRERCRPLA